MTDRYNPFGLPYLNNPVDTPNYAVDSRWPDQPDVADAYRMGGLAAMDQYQRQDAPHAVFGAYDRAQAQAARDQAQAGRVQRSADVARALSGQQGPADVRPVLQGMRAADVIGEALAPSDVFGATTLFNPAKVGRAIPAIAGAVVGSDTAEAASRPRLPRARGGKLGEVAAVDNWTPPPMGHNNPPGPMARYAEEYPPVGPPELAFDKKKQEEYLAKALTPEAVAFQKERKKIIEDMAKNGYAPMFDPAQRFHVNPANYPPNVDTLSIVPKKQETIDKHMETIGGEDARARLRAAYVRGKELPNTENWYALGQLEAEFIKELGPEAGRKAFQDRIATSMAATTGGADPTANWLMAQYGNYLRANNRSLPDASHQYPFPVGGRYAANNMEMHQKVFDEGGFQALGEGNPKRHNFSQDFTGNQNAATMDEQMTSGMTPGLQMPPPGRYGLYEAVLADEASRVGVTPQEYQAIGWSGFKNMKDPSYTRGKPFIETINESIERTHRLTGMPKDEILRRGIIKGEIPMYALMGAVGMGAIADQSRYPK